MKERIYTALFPFGGLGGGALGFAEAHAELLGCRARFRIIGGLDFDAGACADFEYLAGAPSLNVDIASLTSAELRAFAGDEAPDVVFLSPPCKGASGLLSNAKAATARYQDMNQLALRWTETMLSAWHTPPKLVLLENVPRLKKRAASMLTKLRKLLRGAGYVFSDGFHDCGEIGGLAQHRNRYLLVARHTKRVPPLLYQPPTLRVRACGEVLETLPMPEDPAGGRMHVLPRLSWLNWVRLALIPAGGDWRDLPGVLEDGQARRELHRRHHVADWSEPCVTIAGSGSNGPTAVADPRVKRAFDHGYAVLPWTQPSFTIAGGSHPGQGAYSVADPRVNCTPRTGAYGVIPWTEAAKTVTGAANVDNGPWTVADPRTREAVMVIENVAKPPPLVPVIEAEDGTWHRPLTTLELAVLQGFPAVVRGEPLQLAGNNKGAWRERIGNAVPPPAAREIARRMLVTLVQADAEAPSLEGGLAVWVREPCRAEGWM